MFILIYCVCSKEDGFLRKMDTDQVFPYFLVMLLICPCHFPWNDPWVLRGCKNRPAPFPGRMPYKVTKPGLVSVLYLSMRYTVLLFITCRALFYVSLVFVAMCSVFWLFWLSYQYLPSDWLERLRGSRIMVRESSPQSPGQRVCVIFLVYCIASLFYYVFALSPAPTWYNCFPTFMVWYSLSVLKVPLNPKWTI